MEHREITFLRMIHLRGPNLWTYRPVIEALVDIGALEDHPSNTIPGFPQRLTSWLPGLIEHRCGVGERGGFVQRLHEGTWAAHILEHVALELQNLAGMKTGFGKARQESRRGVYKVVIRTRQEDVGRASLETARDLVLAAIEDRAFDLTGAVSRLHGMVDSLCLGPSTASIVDAATERRIPWLRLNEGNLVQLGHGARQRRIWTAETDQTSAIAEGISKDKDLTKRLLESCGVPVPEGRIVVSPQDAWEAAEEIGPPVVVKPVDANHGRGVSLELTTREDVEAAYHLALAEGSQVIVERFVPGIEHRLLVVGGRVAAAARGEAAWVTGDGHSTVVELIDRQLNADPRRGTTEEYPLNRIVLDEDPVVVLDLRRQGLAGDSVPEAGRRVLVQRNGNVAFDCTDRVHPEVAASVSLAARVVGLDVAGVDLVAEDISRPLAPQRGAIVEVNAGPGLYMHLRPAEGEPRPVGRAIVEHLFPEGESGRIPIVGIAGSRGGSAIARLVAWLLHLTGARVGLACADGLFVGRWQVERTDCTNWDAGQRLLINRGVEAAVIENGPRTILGEGLAYDRCRVGVVTDTVWSEDLGDYDVRDPEQMFDILRTQVDVVLPDGAAVLDADDPLVSRMASLCDGEVILYGPDSRSPAIVEQRDRGGRAVFLQGDRIVMSRGRDDAGIVELAAIANAAAGPPAISDRGVLAAVASACALGLPEELIRVGIETFGTEGNPARSSGKRNRQRGSRAEAAPRG